MLKDIIVYGETLTGKGNIPSLDDPLWKSIHDPKPSKSSCCSNKECTSGA